MWSTYITLSAYLILVRGDGVAIKHTIDTIDCKSEYQKLLDEESCSRSSYFNQTQAVDILFNKNTNVTIPLYLTSVIIDLTNSSSLPDDLKPKENETFIVTVIVGKKRETSNFTFKSERIYYAVLNEPIRLSVADNFRFTVHKNNTNWHTNTSDLDHRLATSYIAVKDFCSEGRICAGKIKTYRSLGEECSTFDEFGFLAKYGHCDENDAPEFTTESGKIDWDKFQKNRKPQLVFENYTIREKNKSFQYDIINVKTDKSYPKGNFSSVAKDYHPNCTSPLIPELPRAYFCINQQTGQIFATKKLIESITPIDSFVVTIRVKNFLAFPPRMKIRNITLTAKSICTVEYRSFKELERKCNRFDSNATTFPIDNTTLKNNIFMPTVDDNEKVYLMYGIERHIIDRGVGNIMVILNNYLKHNFTLYSSDKYRSFTKPILYKANETLTLYIFDMSTNKQMDVTHSSWMIRYIDNHNYCSSSDCIQLYSSYHKNYYENEAVRHQCADEDKMGYIAKYYFCNEFRFHKSPIITRNISLGSDVNISNCAYVSEFKADDMYWLKDGKTRINVTDLMPRIVGKDLYKVPSLRIFNTTLKDQGYYQCVVVNRERTIKSEKVNFQISEVAEYRVSMSIKNMDWDNQYKNASSTKYQQLSRQLRKEIEKLFWNGEMTLTNVSRHDNKTLGVTVRIVIIGAKLSERKMYCESVANKLKENTKLGDVFEIEKIKIISYDCCIRENEGTDDYKGQYSFPTILTSSYHEIRCKYHYKFGNASIKRQCYSDRVNGARWGSLDLSSCSTRDEDTGILDDLSKNITEETVAEIAHNVSIIASKKQITNPKNIELISDIVTEIVNVNASNIHVAKNVLKCVSAILNTDRKVVENSKSNSSQNVLKSLNKLAEVQKPTEQGVPKVIQSENLALGVIVPHPDKMLQIISYPKKLTNNSSKLNVDLVQDFNGNNNGSTSSIIIPKDIIKEARDKAIYSYVFDSDVLFLPQSLPDDKTDKTIEKGRSAAQIQSHILSASIENMTVANRSKPLRLHFDLGKKKENGSMKCGFWDATMIWRRSDGKRMKGGWSSEGCKHISGSNGKMSCECNHMTNFAIILNVSGVETKNAALSLISNIGMAISMICLLLTIITNAMFKSIRKKVPPKILINLSSSLFLMYTVFLIGVEQIQPRIACQIFAGLIQYFLLTTFFWMAIEAVNLYRNFVKVFSAGSGNAFLRKCYVIGWGVPLIVTISTGAAKWDQLGSNRMCVLQKPVFYYALLLPISVILVGNFIILFLVLRGINSGAQVRNDSPRRRSKRIAKVRIALACASLLGSTWIFALFAVGKARLFMEYIFCILTSLQGLFIFYFYTFRVKKVRDEWVGFFSHQERSISTASEMSKKSECSDLNTTSTSSLGPNKVKQFNLPAFNLKTIPKKTPGI